MISPVLLALIAGLAHPIASPSSKVANIRLAELTRFAEVICVGRVEEVFELVQPPPEESIWPVSAPIGEWARVPVAKVRVERGLKGVGEGDVVYFLARGTWTCDITRAEVGERALFFLNESDWSDRLQREARVELKKRAASAPVYAVAHSGRGRMPLCAVEGNEYATFWSEVVLPEDLPTIADPEEERSFIRGVHLPSMEERLATLVSAQYPSFSLSYRQALSPDRGWRFRVWGDGYALLFVEDPKTPQRIESRVPAERIRELAVALGKAGEAKLSGRFGQEGLDGPLRRFEGRADGCLVRFELVLMTPGSVVGEEERRRAAGALELWAELRGLFDQPGTLDARVRDRACIAAW